MESIKFIAVIGYVSSEPLSRGGGIKLTLELPESDGMTMAKLHEIKRHNMGLQVSVKPYELDSLESYPTSRSRKKGKFSVKQADTEMNQEPAEEENQSILDPLMSLFRNK